MSEALAVHPAARRTCRTHAVSRWRSGALVPGPLADFEGVIVTGGVLAPIDSWIGSQNDNWGRSHTDEYAWGQVAGFDGASSTFVELVTRLRLATVSPHVTVHSSDAAAWRARTAM